MPKMISDVDKMSINVRYKLHNVIKSQRECVIIRLHRIHNQGGNLSVLLQTCKQYSIHV